MKCQYCNGEMEGDPYDMKVKCGTCGHQCMNPEYRRKHRFARITVRCSCPGCMKAAAWRAKR